MHFSIDRVQFLEKLTIVSRAIAAHSPMPVLSGILMDVQPDKIVLTGSDNNITIQTTIFPGELNQLKIEEPGCLDVDSHNLLEVIRKMGDEIIEIESLGTNLVRVSDKRGIFNLLGMDGNEYPPLDLSRPEEEIHLSAALLKDIVNQVGYAASDKDNRPVLMGINFKAKDGVLSSAATDSYRLAKKEDTVPEDAAFNITIPYKSLREMSRLIPDHEAEIAIYANRKKVQFYFDKTLIQSNLFEGTFPDVDRIIPADFTSELIVNAVDFAQTLDRTSVYRASEGGYDMVRMNLSNSHVTLNCDAKEVGSSDQDLFDVQYTGDDMTIFFNGNYMNQALKGLQTNELIRIQFNGPLRPMKITRLDDDSLVMIVVPIRNA